MAEDWFLKLEGITGDSTDEQHAGEIDVLSWSWGISQPARTAATGGRGGGTGAGKADIGHLQLVTQVGRATPELFLACASGRHFTEAVLTGRRAGGKPFDFLRIVMREVMVSTLQLSAAHGGGPPAQAVSLEFGQIEIAYTGQNPKGQAEDDVVASWDVRRNR